MRYIVAIDPGPEQSALVPFTDGRVDRVFLPGPVVQPNADVISHLRMLKMRGDNVLVIEMIASYGMPVGAEVFETCVWIGRFLEAWGRPAHRLFRREVKSHLCHSSKANDATIRQALIDRFGPGREKAIGVKRAPGPLYGIKGDEWAALAVAVTWWDLHPAEVAA